MSNTNNPRKDTAFAKPQTIPVHKVATPKAKKLKLHTKDPYKGGKAPTHDPFVYEAKDRGGGSPKGP